jgi:predicted RNA binding protein with dsRBD fold (UPF0201 family)
MLRVRVETPCHPTEDPEKVVGALRTLFPDLEVERRDRRILGTTGHLDRLRERIRDQRIRDTARRQLLAGRSADRTTIRLSKQAASWGVVNFAAGSPLGDVLVEIESDDLSAVIDDVAASTVDRPA